MIILICWMKWHSYVVWNDVKKVIKTNEQACHQVERKLPAYCISQEAFIHLSLKVSLILQFIHLSFLPCIDPSIHHLSIHLSAAALTHPYIHPPSLSKRFNEPITSTCENKNTTWLCWLKTHGATSNCGKTISVLASVGKRGRRSMRRKDREGPSVRSHWGQGMAATFTKANSPEEQSTSPVAVDYSIITSTSPTASHPNHSLYSKFIQHTERWAL